MKKKKNNKGFSLVELIVVIAIMAVLVGVLAPQFIGYVAKSRQSTDVQNAEEIAQQIAVKLADVEAGDNTTFSLGSTYVKVSTLTEITGANVKTGSGNVFFACYDGSQVHVAVAASDATPTAANDLYPTLGSTAKSTYDKIK